MLCQKLKRSNQFREMKRICGYICLAMSLLLGYVSIRMSYKHFVSTVYAPEVGLLISVALTLLPLLVSYNYLDIYRSSKIAFSVILACSAFCILLSRGQIISSVNRERLDSDSFDISLQPDIIAVDSRIHGLEERAQYLGTTTKEQSKLINSFLESGNPGNAGLIREEYNNTVNHIGRLNKMVDSLYSVRSQLVEAYLPNHGRDNYSIAEAKALGFNLTQYVGTSVDLLSLVFGFLSSLFWHGRGFLFLRKRNLVSNLNSVNPNVRLGTTPDEVLKSIPADLESCVVWYLKNGRPSNWQVVLADHCGVSQSYMSRSIKDYASKSKSMSVVRRKVAESC